ncbi:hypothetical protein C8Q80DRAFT_1273405 [Daedaleopsis nitida]|nr:hypothetical protein C8Q80DRAFT_1273405 [Daedaleopsis nitida]
MEPDSTPRTSSRRPASTSRSPAGPSALQASSTPPYKPPPPSATTALDAVRELRAILEPYSVSQLNKAQRSELSPFIDNLESLIVLESALPRAADGAPPHSEQVGTARRPSTDTLAPLQASVTAMLRQALESFGKDIKQTVKLSIDNAIKASPRPREARPPPTPAPTPRPAPCNRPKHLKVVIGIPRANQPESFTKQTPAQLKTQVEQALTRSQVTGLAGTAIHGVCRLSNGNILVRATSTQQAELLLRHDREWAPFMMASAHVERKTFWVTARAVPTEFDPAAPRA